MQINVPELTVFTPFLELTYQSFCKSYSDIACWKTRKATREFATVFAVNKIDVSMSKAM